jgi:uncharacterized protein YmfQ (DUF2313 family)
MPNMADFKQNTEAQNAQSFADVMPAGLVWNAKNKEGSILRLVLQALSQEMGRYQADVYQVATEAVPNFNATMLDEWEQVLGIPDDCIPLADNPTDRAFNIMLKLGYLNLQTEADYIRLANLLGLSISISNSYPTMTINIAGFVPPSFPYTFPFVFGADSNNLFQCLVLKQRPAHIEVVFV